MYVWTWFFGPLKVVPTSLKPNTWNSYCLQINSTTAVLKLNEHNIISRSSYEDTNAFSFHIYENDYEIFMNDPFPPSKSPMYGAVTDINIWDTNLSYDRVIFLHLVRCNGEIQIFKKSVFWLKKSCRIDTCIYLMMMQGFVDLKSCLVIFFHEFNVMER